MKDTRVQGLRVPSAEGDVPTVETASLERARELARAAEGLRVTLHLPLPERPGFDDIKSVARRYERAAQDAAKRLVELGVAEPEAEAAAARLREVDVALAKLPRGTRALAVFLGPDALRALALTHAAPAGVHVGRAFALRPLLEELQGARSFRLVALAAHSVRLFEGDAHALTELEARGVPASLEEALGSELSEPQLQHRETPKDVPASFHGHGGAKDERERDRERFHHVLGAALERLWADRRDPLVVAADPAQGGRFRKAAALPRELEPGIEKNPERMKPEELHPLALECVRQHAQRERREALELALAGKDRGKGLYELEAIAQAAAQRRVQRLWLEKEARVERHVDPATGEMSEALGDEDALDELAALVLAAGGDVLVYERAELPPGGEARAPLPALAELRGNGGE